MLAILRIKLFYLFVKKKITKTSLKKKEKQRQTKKQAFHMDKTLVVARGEMGVGDRETDKGD